MAGTKKPWADGPFELIPSSRMGYKKGDKVKGCHEIAVEMIVIHNIILRGINSIYLQCVNVERSPGDVPGFVGFARAWGGLVAHHHGLEETLMFPDIERTAGVEGLMSANVDQHHAFHDGLEKFNTYLEPVAEGKEAYDGKKLKAIIDSFMPVLRQHLSDEIDTLRDLEKYEGNADWDKWFRELQAHIMKKGQSPEMKTTTLPVAMLCHDKSFDDGVYGSWPPMPWFVTIIAKWFWFPKNKAWWQFAPCDANGAPRALPFVE